MKPKGKLVLRLYVTGEAPNSTRAIGNLNDLCREHLAGRYEIEIVDLLREPQRALADEVLLTPTLVKLSPKPVRKIIGNLNDLAAVLKAFGLEVFRNEK
jgi:circadian clock protein KaiB